MSRQRGVVKFLAQDADKLPMRVGFIILFVLGLCTIGAGELFGFDLFDPRVTAMFALESTDDPDAETGSNSLDVERHICDEEEGTFEAFSDTYIALDIVNPSQSLVRIRRTRIRVPKLETTGRSVKLRRSAPIGSLEILPEAAGRVLIPFLKVSGDKKLFAGTNVIADANLIPKNVKVKVILKSAKGHVYKISAQSAFAFGDLERCS
ncbi:MAG: hypothetical protein KDD62_15605 [Bdellovibrionales bacterium]|nr:hypothetical protein [Bdellovibrionales bacterium]